MDKQQILEKISAICREVFGQADLEVTRETSANDVAAWDSMTNLILVDEIESVFGMKFSLDEILNAQNVGDLCDVIAARQNP